MLGLFVFCWLFKSAGRIIDAWILEIKKKLIRLGLFNINYSSNLLERLLVGKKPP